MSVAERVLAHGRGELEKYKVVKVPEWGEGDVPLSIHVHPLTLEEADKISAAIRDGVFYGKVTSLVVRARDADGHRLFKTVNIGEFMKSASKALIDRLFEEMTLDEDAPPETTEQAAAEKKD